MKSLRPLSKIQFLTTYLIVLIVPTIAAIIVEQKRLAENPPIGAVIFPPWLAVIIIPVITLGLGATLAQIFGTFAKGDPWWKFMGYMAPALAMAAISLASIFS